jgi:hypothetical protein
MSDTGLVARPRELIHRKLRRQIDERTGHAGDRNSADHCSVTGIKTSRPTRPDPLDAPFAHAENLRWARPALQQPPQVGGRLPAQDRTIAGGQDSGQVGGLDTRRSVPDAVDAGVLAEQVAPPQPGSNRLPRHAGVEQLRPGDNSVARARHRRQFLLNRPGSGLHTKP